MWLSDPTSTILSVHTGFKTRHKALSSLLELTLPCLPRSLLCHSLPLRWNNFSFETEIVKGVSSLPVGGRYVRPRPAHVRSPNLEVISGDEETVSSMKQIWVLLDDSFLQNFKGITVLQNMGNLQIKESMVKLLTVAQGSLFWSNSESLSVPQHEK